MPAKTNRKIVKIDESKCNGCGICVPSCAEGAIRIIDGKARLVSETYCDGLGACLGECPLDAITIEERPADNFDEDAAMRHLEKTAEPKAAESLNAGCPSSRIAQFEAAPAAASSAPSPPQKTELRHWPVQLTLVPPAAPFLQGADVLLAADCAPFAYPNFHSDFLKGKSLLIACPKLDDLQAHIGKLTDILRQSDVKSLTVLHMEVPCCFGLVAMARQAVQASGKNIPLHEVTLGIKGDIKSGV
jgi:Pyruvate/2-oxoacid:ferredoxin oxidoreductase delta subunit